jgi:uroporphyrinogen-III synthase
MILPMRALGDRRVLILRSEAQSQRDADVLISKGASVIFAPCTEIRSLPSAVPTLRAFLRAQSLTDGGMGEKPSFPSGLTLAFTSANGVRVGLSALASALGSPVDSAVRGPGNWPADWPVKLQVACVGTETRRALEQAGLVATILPSDEPGSESGAGLAKAIMRERARGASGDITQVLWCGAREPRAEFADELARLGVPLYQVPVYATQSPKERLDRLRAALSCAPTDVLFHAPSSVRVAFDSPFASSFAVLRCYSIGPTTSLALAQALRPHGGAVAGEAVRPTPTGFVDAMLAT